MRKIICISLFAVSAIVIIIMGTAASGYFSGAYAQKQDSVENRLLRLEDREAILKLLTDYGRFLDQREFESFSRLFAEKDGEWDGGMGKAKSPKEIRKLMEDTIGKNTGNSGAPNFHIFTNETIQLNGDRANATTKWIFMVQGTEGRPQPFYLGHYEDTLIRENGRWKFLRRVVHSDIPSDAALSKK
jgi:hypothetical protein